MRSRIGILLAVPLLVAAAACGGSDDAASTGETPVDTSTNAEVDSDVDDADSVVEPSDEDLAAPPAGGGTAVLTLDNGEMFEFDGVMCTLEPQIAAGSEILFTATSYGDPGIDITQFGDDGVLAGVATVEVYNASYETLWEAFSIGGSTVELTLEGSTIRGTADFYSDDDDDAGLPAPVRGEVVANC